MTSITRNDIITSLRNIGLKKGQTVFFHNNSDLFKSFETSPSKKKSAQLLLESIDEVIDFNQGNLIVPTFNYDFCRGADFDIQNTPAQVGYFSNYLLTKRGSFRSHHPIFSVAVMGKNAKEITENISMDAFGKNSIFDRLTAIRNSLLVFFNADFQTCTYVHYIEQKLEIPYRFIKEFHGNIIDQGKIMNTTCSYLVRPLDGSVITTLAPLEQYLISQKVLNKIPFYSGHISSIKTTDMLAKTAGVLEQFPYFMLEKNPKTGELIDHTF